MKTGVAIPLPPAGDDTGLDYAALLKQGTTLVQGLSGALWTNYNWSDPGVTVLQQLCYALTELSYRSDFPVEDLLGAPGSGLVALRRQGLYPARAIMPVNPVTIDDLRRLIIDRVPHVGNAWFAKAPVTDDQPVSGLYRIAVLVPGLDPGCDDHGPSPHQVRRDVLDCYAAHRALCEDVEDVVILQPIRARVRASVQLDDHVDPDKVLGELLFHLALALAPEPRRESLDQQHVAGLTTAEIFNGPLMLRGFIPGDQLTVLPSEVPVEYLLEVMAEVPGVLSVDHLSVQVLDQTYALKDTIHVQPGHILWLETEPGVDGHAIRLMHGASTCRTSPVKVQRKLTRDWADQRRTYPLWAQYARGYQPPLGRGMDLAAYSSVQNQFPEVYGIGTYGLPPGAGPTRRGQAKQLKGYLMVFDQLMADFFAQLAFVRDLFSIAAGGDKTYVSQSLRHIVPNAQPLLEPGYEECLKALVAAGDPIVARQAAVLDFLLSLYAETLAPPADAACGGIEPAPGTALVEAKKALLAKLVPATRDRGRGFDYRRAHGDSPAAGLDIRCRIELALLDATSRRDGAEVVADREASFGWRLPPELSQVVAQTFLPVDTAGGDRSPDSDAVDAPSPLAGQTVAAALMPALADPSRYSVGALPGNGPVYLVCRDIEDACWVLGEFRNVAEAVAMTDRMIHAAAGHERRLYVVEWTLLRFAREHDHHRHHHHHGHYDDANEDYSFRISAVMPAGDGEADSGWRQQARQIVRNSMPAHIVVQDLFLHHRRMRHFRHLYHAWVAALREGSRERRAKTSWHLERFLQRGMPHIAPPPVPPPPPPPLPILPPMPVPVPVPVPIPIPAPVPVPVPPAPPGPQPAPVLPGTVEFASPGALGFDADTVLDATSAAAFASAGFRFAIRYLTRDGPEQEPDLTAQEALAILDAGLALMAVQHVAPAGWVPSAALGIEHGGWAAANAASVGLPPGVSIWLDLEGVTQGTPAEAVIAYCDGWHDTVSAAGYLPGLYVGAKAGLDGEQLSTTRFGWFWESGSDVPAPARGYCMVQTIAGEAIDGVPYDSDLVQSDGAGRLPFYLAPPLRSATD